MARGRELSATVLPTLSSAPRVPLCPRHGHQVRHADICSPQETTLGTPHSPLLSQKSCDIRSSLLPLFPKEISDGHPGVVVGIMRSLPGKRVAPLLGAVPCATHTGSRGSRRVPCRFLQRPLTRPWAQDTGESGWSLQKPGRPSGDSLSICFFLAFPGSLVGLGGPGGAQGSSECAHHRLVLACVFLAPGDPVKSDTTVPSSRPCSAPVT